MRLFQVAEGVLINPEEIAYVRQIDWIEDAETKHTVDITLRCGEVKNIPIDIKSLWEACGDRANCVDLGLRDSSPGTGRPATGFPPHGRSW